MALRLRVLVAFALVLSLTAVLAAGLAGWRARATLHSELVSALATAERSVAEARAHGADARRVIATFDGDRHVRAVLVGAVPPLASHAAHPETPAPAGFAALVDPHLPAVTTPLEAGQAIRLEPAPEADLAAAWLNFRDLALVLAIAFAAGCALVFLVIGQALRPLRDLTHALGEVGGGNYRAEAPESGPPEVAGIARAFNQMTGRLLAAHDRNRALEDQLLRLQDEERADIARDLHDEFGPHLFAVSVDAALVATLAAEGRTGEIGETAASIQQSVAHMQAQVRDILGRLRPARVAELGLERAVRDLIGFWSARDPDVAFTLDASLDEARLTDEARDAAYRVVQEGLSNAVRHGRPTHVQVTLAVGEDGSARVSVADDGAGGAADTGQGTGFGLRGMTERVEQAGGALTLGPGVGGRGWAVAASLPLQGAAA